MAKTGNSGDSDLLQCYNTSCGLKFTESENGEDSCTYHSGKPYFHDGYKEWTCCKMKSRDFTIFMSFKGCTKGKHNSVKPEEPKPVESSASNNGTSQNSSTEKIESFEEEALFVPPSQDLVENVPIFESPNVASASTSKNIIICKNCKQEESSIKLDAPCLYHRGVQIFHDSLKYWSCCPHKKFTEFDEFQSLPPCASADAHDLIIKVDIKENWFQAGQSITIALYGLKGARLDKSVATLHGARLLSVVFFNATGIKIFEKKWNLSDYVIASESKVLMNPSNVQITLVKANKRVHWSALTVADDKAQ